MEEDDKAARIAALERELAALGASRASSVPFGEGPKEREALLAEAERIVHLGSWMWDTATGAIRWSDELFRIFGHAPQSFVPTPESFFERIHPEDVARVRDTAARGLRTRSLEPIDFRFVRRDGATRRAHMEAALVEADDGLRLVGTVIDVTARLALEERLLEAQKLEALGTLASGVAHDFNNYLQVIFGHLDLLDGLGGSASQTSSLAQIREAAARCRRLTRQLLVFGRAGEAGEPEVLELDAVLDQATPMFVALLGDRVRLRRVRADAELRVRCDRGALEQLVMNLLVNARDAMPMGGRVTIDVTAREVPAGHTTLPRGRYVVLAVEDEGGGIAEEVLPRIFEPFFSTKGVGHGTGLGLAVAHGIVTRHGGAIEVDNRPGKSATFRVLLPLARATPRLVEPVRPSTPPPSRPTVLVVEDQDSVRSLVRALLASDGYSVVEAPDGLEALEILRARPDVSLVLSDIAMPRMTGVELWHALRAERPGLPVVLMGGVIDSSVAGLDATLLPKPFGREELLRVIQAALPK